MTEVAGLLLKFCLRSYDSTNPSIYLPKIKDSRKEVLYKFKLLLIIFMFRAHTQASNNGWMVHRVSQQTKSKVSEFVSSSNIMVAGGGIYCPFLKKKKPQYNDFQHPLWSNHVCHQPPCYTYQCVPCITEKSVLTYQPSGRHSLSQPLGVDLYHSIQVLAFLITRIKFQGKYITVRLEPIKLTCPVPEMKHIPRALLALCSDEMY